MAVVSAVASHRASEGELTFNPGIPPSWGNRYAIEYNVKCSAITDGPVTIAEYFRVTGGLPYIGDTYQYGSEFDNNAYCMRLSSVKKDRSQTEWTTVAEFQVPPDGQDPTTNPLDRRKTYIFDFAPRQVVAHSAYWSGNYRIEPNNLKVEVLPIAGFYQGLTKQERAAPANSAGDTLDPPMMKDESDLVLIIQQNEASFDAEEARDLKDTLNDANIQLDLTATEYNCILRAYQYQLKLVAVRGIFQVEQWINTVTGALIEQPYYQKSYEFHLRPGIVFTGADQPLGWREFLLDHGYNRSYRQGDPDGAGGTKANPPEAGNPATARTTTELGFPVSEKVNLNGRGQPLDEQTTNDKLPVYMEYRKEELSDFTALPLGFTSWTP